MSQAIEKLRVCRGCLTADVRLYDMYQNQLMEAYTRLIQVSDELPHYLCSYCAALLLKCDSFRNKCIDSQAVFRDSHFGNVQLTLQHIKEINTHNNPYKQSNTKILNIDEINRNDNDNTDSYEHKHAIDNDSLDSESVKEEAGNNHDNYEHDPLSDEKDYIIIKTETGYLVKDSNDLFKYFYGSKDDNKASNEKLRKSRKKERPKVQKELDSNKHYRDNDMATIEPSNDNDILKDENNDGINTVINKRRHPKFTLKDYEIFSKEYNMTFTYLKTKDEQIKNFQEILCNRRQSDNYNLGTYKCDVCFKGFVLNEAYNKHMVLHKESSSKYFCDICNLYFNNKHSYQGHLTRHSRRFACRECRYTTDVKESARDHYLWHGGFKYSCKLCDKKLNGRSSYYAHLKVVHPTSDELMRCEMCGDSFCGATGIKQHERMAHKEMRSPECYCTGCNTQFYCSDAFKAHQGADGLCITTHKYCVRCGMSFETEQLLNEHEIEQRRPRDEFKCEVTKLGLRLHHYNIHTNIRPYECNVCKKAFKSTTSLKFHKRVHTGERPFQCEICPKSFKCCTNLSRHKRVHTGERRFSCDICSKSFQTKRCVQMHIKTVHMRIPMPPRIRRRKKKTE